MKFRKITRYFVRLFPLVCIPFLLSGCDSIQLAPPSMDVGAKWVSPEGKTSDQFQDDQAACRRDIALVRPQSFGSGGPGSDGWGVSEFRQFESCMRAKGWRKE